MSGHVTSAYSKRLEVLEKNIGGQDEVENGKS